jgi:natural product biosynthesis luciferase-like monooxygenase protein
MTRQLVFLGDEALTVQCAQIAEEASLQVAGLVSRHPLAQEWARERGLPLVDRTNDLVGALAAIQFDVLVSVAYLRLIPDELLAMADTAVNFHDGPLPTYAGLHAPNWAILNGEEEHAITWHLIGSGIDDGDVLLTERFPIAPDDTAYTLNVRCYEHALRTFPMVAAALSQGAIRATPQAPSGRRLYLRHERPAAETVIVPGRPAAQYARFSRAFDTGGRRRQEMGVLRLVLGDHLYLVTRCRAAASSRATIGSLTLVSTPPADGVTTELRFATIEGDLIIESLSDARGIPVRPDQIIQDGRFEASLSLDAERLADALGRIDARLARGEARIVDALAVARPNALESSAGGAGALLDRRGIGGVGDIPPRIDVPVPLPRDVHDEDVLAGIATWLVRRCGGTSATFALITAAIDAAVNELWPLTRPPLCTIDVPDGITAEELVASVRDARERAEADGVWLADLVAREPSWRSDPPAEPEIGVSIGVRSDHVRPPLLFTVVGDSLTISASGEHFDRQSVERFADELSMLQRALADSPARPVRRAPIVTDHDRALLDELNDTARPRDETLTIDAAFRQCVAARPDEPALTHDSRQLSYADLAGRVGDFAATLSGAGIGRNDRVGIALPRGVDMVVAVLATLDVGAAYVPLDPSYPHERLAFMIGDAGLAALVGEPPVTAALGGESVIALTPSDPSARRIVTDRTHTSHDLAYVIYTSGSTGQPKGVMLEHRHVTNFFLAMDEVIEHDPPGVWLAVTSLSFDISVLELLWTLTRGFHVVIGGDARHPRRERGRSDSPTFSLFHFAANEATDADGYRLLLEGARFADQNGFEAVWMPERHFHEFGGIYPNPSVLAAAVAAITERVGIRAGSCVVPLHHPARVAEEWAVVDNLSHGRVGIAAAAGWQPNDFVLRPESFEDSKRVMFESLDTIRELWEGRSVTMDGPHGPVEIRTLPRPVQRELPVWITSAGNADTFISAGQRGHRLLTHLLGQSIDQLREKIAAYRSAWVDAGHTGRGQVTLMIHTYLEADGDAAQAKARPHMKEYLRSATGLLRDVASSFPRSAAPVATATPCSHPWAMTSSTSSSMPPSSGTSARVASSVMWRTPSTWWRSWRRRTSMRSPAWSTSGSPPTTSSPLCSSSTH